MENLNWYSFFDHVDTHDGIHDGMSIHFISISCEELVDIVRFPVSCQAVVAWQYYTLNCQFILIQQKWHTLFSSDTAAPTAG